MNAWPAPNPAAARLLIDARRNVDLAAPHGMVNLHHTHVRNLIRYCNRLGADLTFDDAVWLCINVPANLADVAQYAVDALNGEAESDTYYFLDRKWNLIKETS